MKIIHDIKSRKFYKKLIEDFGGNLKLIKFTFKNYYSYGCEIKVFNNNNEQGTITIEPMNFKNGLQWKVSYSANPLLSLKVNFFPEFPYKVNWVNGSKVIKEVNKFINLNNTIWKN